MRRSVAVVWHASFSIVAAVLYFFFVLPRWFEFIGSTSHTLGTVLRIVTAALIGLAALPVVFTLLRTRRPEFGTPQSASRLRIVSIALHGLAGALILGAAISEIWLDLDSAGRWLFGIYGAAAAIGLLGIFGFYLAFVAELPPPLPKPLKPKGQTRRGRRKAAPTAETTDAAAAEETERSDIDEPVIDPDGAESEDTGVVPAADEEKEAEEPEDTDEADEPDGANETEEAREAEGAGQERTSHKGGLRNRRPSGKSESARRRRLRGGIAVED